MEQEQETSQHQPDSSDELSSEREYAIGDASLNQQAEVNMPRRSTRQRRPVRRFTYDEGGNPGYDTVRNKMSWREESRHS